MCVHAKLAFGEEGKTLRFYNTHLDQKGATARLLGMNQIMQSISKCDALFVLTGDMNANPDTVEAQLPMQLKNKTVKDATADITNTFHGFGKIEKDRKIDYIYTDADFFLPPFSRLDVPLYALRLEEQRFLLKSAYPLKKELSQICI